MSAFVPQARHGMSAVPVHDEASRQDFVLSFRRHLAANVASGIRTVLERRAEPAFVRANGRPCKDRREVRKALSTDPYYQLWGAFQRGAQELMWDSVIDTVERTWPDMTARARAFARSNTRRGSLTLDPALPVPRYLAAHHIHTMPGSYCAENGEGDITAGAVYDRGVYIYIRGSLGPFNNGQGAQLVSFFQEKFAGCKPARMIDLGCTVGHSTLAWADAFPSTEVHAVDVSAACLRYAHGRAESLGHAVHFSQQNAERTNFADASFDLVVSHILFHETSTKAVANVLRESLRLLKPGGIMLHMEIPQDKHMDKLDSCQMEWEAYNNNEDFLATMRDLDFEAMAIDAGFSRERVKLELVYSTLPGARRESNGGRLFNPILVGVKGS